MHSVSQVSYLFCPEKITETGDAVYITFLTPFLHVLLCCLGIRSDEVVASVDDENRSGVFTLVKLFYLVVVLFGYYPAEEAFGLRKVGVSVMVQELLGLGYLPEVDRSEEVLFRFRRGLPHAADELGQFFLDTFDDRFRYFLDERAFLH